MTKLANSPRPLVRETAVVERGRPVVVELWPGHLAVRLKGEQKEYSISYRRLLLECERRGAEQKREHPPWGMGLLRSLRKRA